MYRLQLNVNSGALMTKIISTRVPNEIADALKEIEEEEKTDTATIVRKLLVKAIQQWKSERALRLYREGKVTLWRAARLAGVTLREMMELAAKREFNFNTLQKNLKKT